MDAETLRNELLTSQWYGFSPGNISYTGGNVGIGTNNPLSTLQVSGTSAAFTCGGTVGTSNVVQIGTPTTYYGTASVYLSTRFAILTSGLPVVNDAFNGNGGVWASAQGIRLQGQDLVWSGGAIRSYGSYIEVDGGGSKNAAISYGQIRCYTANNQRLTIDEGGNVGINSSIPGTTLDVSGIGRFTTVTTGGWLLMYLSTASYANGNQDLVWTSIANNRIVLNANGIQFNIPDAGVYIINIQLNADTTATCNMTVAMYIFSGGTWVNQQNSEWNTSWNTSVETRCQFFINNTTSTDYKFQIWNGSGAAFAFAASVVWSRASIFKIG